MGYSVVDSAAGSSVGRVPRARLMLVEPDRVRRLHLRTVFRKISGIQVDVEASFTTARRHLLRRPYDWLVTNVRLAAYNGLHLVHEAKTKRRLVRFLVYDEQCDVGIAREVQRVGAFYESYGRVDRVLPAVLRATLPPLDRRNPSQPDRRHAGRGGRRCTDSSAA